MHDQPRPTEEEQEQAQTERQREEEAMRQAGHEEPDAQRPLRKGDGGKEAGGTGTFREPEAGPAEDD